jgi:hypothetical protein
MTERITMTDQCVPTGMPTTLPSRTLCCFMVAPPRLTAAPPGVRFKRDASRLRSVVVRPCG